MGSRPFPVLAEWAWLQTPPVCSETGPTGSCLFSGSVGKKCNKNVIGLSKCAGGVISAPSSCLIQRFAIPVLAPPRSAYFACLSLLTHLIQIISSLEVCSMHELCSDWHAPYTVSIAPTQCPLLPTQCPLFPTQGPLLPTQCPLLPTQCPLLPTQCPLFPTQGPLLPTQCPLLPTQGPLLPTQCPLLPTQGPLLPTQGPLLLHRVHCSLHRVGPLLPTQGPLLPTQCPLLPTQGPLLPTQSIAPYTVSIAPYTVSIAPYTGSIAPYTGSIAPYTVSIAPYTVSIAPYTGSIAPYTVSIAPYTGSIAPYTGSIAPYTGSIAPSLHRIHCSLHRSIAPYTGPLLPTRVHCSLHRVHCSLHRVHCSLLPEQGNPLKFTSFRNIHSWICATQRLHARTSVTSYTSVNIYNLNSRLAHFNALWMEYIRSLRTGIMEEYPVISTSQGTYVPIEQTSEAIRVTYEICRAGGARTGIENRCAMGTAKAVPWQQRNETVSCVFDIRTIVRPSDG